MPKQTFGRIDMLIQVPLKKRVILLEWKAIHIDLLDIGTLRGRKEKAEILRGMVDANEMTRLSITSQLGATSLSPRFFFPKTDLSGPGLCFSLGWTAQGWCLSLVRATSFSERGAEKNREHAVETDKLHPRKQGDKKCMRN